MDHNAIAILTMDFETRSDIDLKKVGAWAYAEGENTDIICAAFKADDQPTKLWFNSPLYFPDVNPEDIPIDFATSAELLSAIERAEIIEAHNAGFEHAMYQKVGAMKYKWPEIPAEKWRCSAAKAAILSLPRSLEFAGDALQLEMQKNKDGRRIMLKYCKPRTPSKKDPSKWWHDPQELTTLLNYCITDVESEHSLSKTLPDLPPTELRVWKLDQQINSRGLYVDLPAAEAAVDLICEYEQDLEFELSEITSGIITSGKQVTSIVNWLKTRGLIIPDLTKPTVTAFVSKPDLTPEVKRVLEIRQALARSSTAKYQALLSRANKDSRIRDVLLYSGASRTARWSGKGFQPQNLPRGSFKDTDQCISIIRNRSLKDLTLLYGNPIEAFSTCIRGMITAAPGYDLICADFSSIEARVLAWLAGEEKVLHAFNSNLDLYVVAAADIYHKPYDEIDENERQIGKIAVLALGYAGGLNAFKSMATNFGIDLPDKMITDIVRKWRDGNQKIVNFWYAMEKAALSAIDLGEKKFYRHKNIKWGINHLNGNKGNTFLHCTLPSGRSLAYFKPKVMEKETPWGTFKPVLTYMGTGLDGKLRRETSYGGKMAENITQAIARDLMAEAMLRIAEMDNHKYRIILTVHDEIVAEVKEGQGDLKAFETEMARQPEWATKDLNATPGIDNGRLLDLPLQSKGWIGKRYHK